jgi:hypothetical protein
MDHPWRLGLSTGIGTIIKLQPALLVGWAAVTGRRRAALVALGIVAALAAVATLVAGPQAWLDEASLLGRSAIASFLAVVIASQFMSPVLWDHYAVILLLPVAWLMDRGRWWASLILLATSTPLLLVNAGAAVVYPIVFWVALLAVVWEGLRDRRRAV